MQWKDGLRVPTNLMETACWHYGVEVVCGCGHRATFDPHGLWWWFEQRHWSNGLTDAKQCFWCRPCAGRIGRRIRPVQINVVRESADAVQLPLPDERVGKRVVSRMRY